MRVLLVDDEDRSRKAVSFFLREGMEYEVVECADGVEAIEIFKHKSFPIVISDIKMPEMDGIELLKQIKKLPEGKGSSVILMTGFADVDSAVTALREGAYDYLYKPVSVDTLSSVLNKLKQERVRKKGESKEYQIRKQRVSQTILIPDYGTIGIFSAEMRRIVDLAYRLHEDRTIPVLIEGETGTGKEVIARLIHHGGDESKNPLVSVNCPAIAPTLFESELFGYEPGAFTGATRTGGTGKLEMAQGGTLFLDEIGELPMEMQPKLLRVLQERELYRVGGGKRIDLDVRIIAASNRNLQDDVKKGKFREDLYFRLNLGKIELPPLREQVEAIGHLAQLILIQLSESKGRLFRHISVESREILEKHRWPGNIRELHNTIERVLLLYNGDILLPEHLSFIGGDSNTDISTLPTLSLDNFVLPEDSFDIRALNTEVIMQALKKFNGNKTSLSVILCKSKNWLY